MVTQRRKHASVSTALQTATCIRTTDALAYRGSHSEMYKSSPPPIPALHRYMLSLNQVTVPARGHHPSIRTPALPRILPKSISDISLTITFTHRHSHSSISRGHKLTYTRHPAEETSTLAYDLTLLSPYCTLTHSLPEPIPCINTCTCILPFIHVAFSHSNEHSSVDLLLNSLTHSDPTSIDFS